MSHALAVSMTRSLRSAIVDAADKMLLDPSLVRCRLAVRAGRAVWEAEAVGTYPPQAAWASGTGPDPVSALDAMMTRAREVCAIQRGIHAEATS